MSTEQHEALKLADAYADASFEQGLDQRTEDPAPEKAREALAKEINAMHALIVQMAGALDWVAKIHKDPALAHERDPELWLPGADEANAAATQYLKGPKA